MTDIGVAVAESAAALGQSDWQELCPPDDPFLNPHFLPILERHGAAGRQSGWRAQHLLARGPKGETAGFLPLYLKFNSHGEFIHDWSWAAAYRQLGREYYPKLFSGLPHTPAAGPRLLLAPGADAAAVRRALAAAARDLAGELGLSSWHVAFPAEEEAETLAAAGLLPSHDVQFHWRDAGYGDFDGYLGSFSAEKRRKVRAERRRVEAAGIAIEVRHGNEVEPREWPRLHALYAATFERFGNHAAFSADCFADLAAALARRMVVFIARQRGEPAAVALCFRSRDTLYGRYWGSRGVIPGLHFELCFYQGISYCLREGLRCFEPGAGGEHKIARGFVPTVVRSWHWIADPGIRGLIGRHLQRQAEGVAAYRDEAAGHLPFRQGD